MWCIIFINTPLSRRFHSNLVVLKLQQLRPELSRALEGILFPPLVFTNPPLLLEVLRGVLFLLLAPGISGASPLLFQGPLQLVVFSTRVLLDLSHEHGDAFG